MVFEQDGEPASWLKASKMMRRLPELQPENVEPNIMGTSSTESAGP